MNRLRKFLFKNTTTRQTILKNTFWMGASTTLIKIVRAVIIIYAARLLGTESYGIFTYAMSVVAIFAVVSDMGISSILIRELSKHTERMKEYFSTALVIKLILLCAMLLLVVGLAPFVSHFEAATSIMLIISLSVIFESLRGFFYSIPRAQSKMEAEAGISIVNEFLCTILIVGFFLQNPSPYSLALSFMIGNGVGLIIALFSIRRYIFGIAQHINWSLLMPLAKMTLPFAILGIFGIFMTNIDSVIIGIFGNEHMLGLYGAAQRPLNILYILPNFLSASLLPILSRFAKEGKSLAPMIGIASSASLTVALPFVIGGIIVAGPLISVVFGAEYAGAVSTFQVLLLTIFFTFPGTIYAEVLLVENKQRIFITTGIIGALLNVGLNFVLIPLYGIVGSAIATVIAQMAVNTVFYVEMRKTQKVPIAKKFYRSLLAVIGMAVFTYAMTTLSAPLLLIIPLSGLLYIGILFVLRDYTILELRKSARTI